MYTISDCLSPWAIIFGQGLSPIKWTYFHMSDGGMES